MNTDCDVAIIDAGIGGVTLALCLREVDISCQMYEAFAEIKPIGEGILRKCFLPSHRILLS